MRRLCCVLLLLVASLASAQPLPTVLSPPSVTLTWDAPADMSKVLGWQMQRCQVPAGSTTCTPTDVGAPLPLTPRTWTDASLTPGSSALYAVLALGANSLRSDPTPVFPYSVPPLTPAPAQQILATAQPGFPPTVRITWQPPRWDDTTLPASALTRYLVVRRPGTLTVGAGVGWVAIGTLGPTLLSWDDGTPLIGGSCYLLRAVYGAQSIDSDASCVVVADPRPPAPTNLRLQVGTP